MHSRCLQPQPFAYDEAEVSHTDVASYAILAGTWLLVLLCLLAFSSCGCWAGCKRCEPRVGGARSNDEHAALRQGASSGADARVQSRQLRVAADPECGGLCCDNFNTHCARFSLLAMALLALCLPLAALSLDSWSMSRDSNVLLRAPFTLVETVEGTRGVSVRRLRDADGHGDGGAQVSYTYDCSSGSHLANLECQVHAVAGVHALAAAALAAMSAALILAMAAADLCCRSSHMHPWSKRDAPGIDDASRSAGSSSSSSSMAMLPAAQKARRPSCERRVANDCLTGCIKRVDIAWVSCCRTTESRRTSGE